MLGELGEGKLKDGFFKLPTIIPRASFICLSVIIISFINWFSQIWEKKLCSWSPRKQWVGFMIHGYVLDNPPCTSSPREERKVVQEYIWVIHLNRWDKKQKWKQTNKQKQLHFQILSLGRLLTLSKWLTQNSKILLSLFLFSPNIGAQILPSIFCQEGSDLIKESCQCDCD